MKELAIHCTIYVPGEWDETDADKCAYTALDEIQSVMDRVYAGFDYQLYEAEVRKIY